jgi:glycosyltransferase involved in cell wall biosynthesis
MGTCIIIPAYNAANTIADVAREALQTGLPLLVVDDGSRDGTVARLKGLPVNLFSHRENRGKGSSLRTGFEWALRHGFAGVVTIDADGQHDASAIPFLAATAAERDADILIASRAVQFRQMAGLRSTWNRFGSWCIERRTGFDISDSQSGFRYYSARLLRGVELSAAGYNMEMEILLKAWRGGFRIGSVPVAARVADGRATSHFRAVPDTWQICMTFLRYM